MRAPPRIPETSFETITLVLLPPLPSSIRTISVPVNVRLFVSKVNNGIPTDAVAPICIRPLTRPEAVRSVLAKTFRFGSAVAGVLPMAKLAPERFMTKDPPDAE